MVQTNDTAKALQFCAEATRLGLGLEVTAEGRGLYRLECRDADMASALWWLLQDGNRKIDHTALQAEIDAQEEEARHFERWAEATAAASFGLTVAEYQAR